MCNISNGILFCLACSPDWDERSSSGLWHILFCLNADKSQTGGAQFSEPKTIRRRPVSGEWLDLFCFPVTTSLQIRTLAMAPGELGLAQGGWTGQPSRHFEPCWLIWWWFKVSLYFCIDSTQDGTVASMSLRLYIGRLFTTTLGGALGNVRKVVVIGLALGTESEPDWIRWLIVTSAGQSMVEWWSGCVSSYTGLIQCTCLIV